MTTHRPVLQGYFIQRFWKLWREGKGREGRGLGGTVGSLIQRFLSPKNPKKYFAGKFPKKTNQIGISPPTISHNKRNSNRPKMKSMHTWTPPYWQHTCHKYESHEFMKPYTITMYDNTQKYWFRGRSGVWKIQIVFFCIFPRISERSFKMREPQDPLIS